MKKLLLSIALLVSGMNMFGAENFKSINDALRQLLMLRDVFTSRGDPLVKDIFEHLAAARFFASVEDEEETKNLLKKAIGLPGAQTSFKFVHNGIEYKNKLNMLITRVLLGRDSPFYEDTPLSHGASSSGESSSIAGDFPGISYSDITSRVKRGLSRSLQQLIYESNLLDLSTKGPIARNAVELLESVLLALDEIDSLDNLDNVVRFLRTKTLLRYPEVDLIISMNGERSDLGGWIRRALRKSGVSS